MNMDLSRVGKILRDKREERGLSIEYLSEELCLRKTLIEAIEKGNWGALPHEVYVRGFVREYAALVGALDEVAECSVAPEKTELVNPAAEAPVREKRKSGPRKFPGARFVYFGILAVVMLFFVYDKIEKERALSSKTERASHVNRTSEAEKEVSGVSSVSEVKSGSETNKLSAISGTKKLMITCHERTWVSVVIDGKEKKEFMLSPEEIIMVNGTERFDLLVGNAGGVKLLLNGKDVEFTGKSGEVKRVQLS